MKNNLKTALTICLLLDSSLYGWGKKIIPTNEANKEIENDKLIEEKPQNDYQRKEIQNTHNIRKKNNIKHGKTKEEYRRMVFNRLKDASNNALNIVDTGETIYINIPISNPVLISFPHVIEDVIWPSTITKALHIINQAEISSNKTKILKLRSVSPLLRNEEVLVKLVNGQWTRISFSTLLNREKYNEINILEELDVIEKKKKELLKNKYFNKHINVKEVSKKEVIKAVNLIVDRLETNTKSHLEQLSLEEKINSVILNDRKRKIMFVLKTVVAEPFDIVGGIYKDNIDQKKETEIVLLNLVIENYGNKNFKLTPTFFKEAFNNYIAFYYDVNNPIIPAQSKSKALVVIEDHHLDK